MCYRKVFALCLTVLLMSTVIQPLFADETAPVQIRVDGTYITTEKQPVIINDRTMIPLRGVFETLDTTVDWNKSTRQAILKTESKEVLLTPDNTDALVNGRLMSMDTPATLVDDSLYIPVRFVAEAMGHDVDWDGATRTVSITSVDAGISTQEALPTVGSKEALISLLDFHHSLNDYYYRFDGFDGGMPMPVLETTEDVAPAPDTMMNEAEAMESAKATEDFSGTNNQEEGVEEGDLILTDGQYIISSDYDTITVIDPNPDAPELLWQIPVDTGRGSISNMFLADGKLVVLGSSYVSYGIPEPLMETEVSYYKHPYYSTTNTFVLVYDLMSDSTPELIVDQDYEGRYLSARMIDDSLYLVTNKDLNYLHLEDVTDYEILPKSADNLKGTTEVIGYEALKYFPDYLEPAIMTTVGINITNGSHKTEAYLGSAETVYASAEKMILAFTKYSYSSVQNGLIYEPTYVKSTSLYQFGLNGPTISYEKHGSVPGTLINQFSLSHFNGHLRVATTTGETWSEDNPSANNLFILDSDLEQVGSVENLAPGETIYSIRAHEDRIYMVTFRQIDPFFVIDASNPEAPEVLGQLKIPGFSTYMHILDADHVLGFGTDTEENDGRVTTGGMKLSLFDVTDPENPIERQKETIGIAGTYSELQHNHKALMISLNKGIMGFPISVANTTPYSNDFNGAYVYDITRDSFSFKGSVSHKSDSQGYYSDPVRRLLYIGDYLYTLSNGEMKITSLDSMKTINTLELDK